MKFSHVLPLAALSTAFVLPSEEVLSEIAIEKDHRQSGWQEDVAEAKKQLVDGFDEVADEAKSAWNKLATSSKSILDEAFEMGTKAAYVAEDSYYDASAQLEAWLRTEGDDFYDSFDDEKPPPGGPHPGPPPPPPHPPHDGPPGHKKPDHEKPPHHGPPDHDHPPHHGPPHHGPPHHGGPPNQTVYELINSSKYTTELAKLINKYDDLVEALNSTKANYTVFAPTDKAFEKIPDRASKPSKEQLKAILSYHVVDGLYPAGRVLVTHTAPTLLEGKHLSKEKKPQRVAFKITLRGLTVNFYSRIIAVNIFGTNGVIHGVDSLLIPPPSVIEIVDLVPGEFSTLELGLGKTGLLETLNTTHHAGGTLFAPSNFAFQKLGSKINAFLFSSYGLKYLKALLEYHVVPDHTLYSDAYYHDTGDKKSSISNDIPKGLYHVDLPTMLEDRKLAVDVARYGGFITIKVNAFARVTVQDGIAEDGVIQIVSDVIVPPKQLPGMQAEYWTGEDMSVEELKERLEPFLAKKDL
ncbi:hypothetical protein LTR62_001827 [Meristemomyces frigidus]|uniref:FAS1 domain-containing protein n=1 Tax=Meristemomyces frigidus TaxID=1508187 RepID=A0AAN7YLM4_9PEZI|nr:hypothetical protein LTR62_001827 [Meristemomyces frigidus]